MIYIRRIFLDIINKIANAYDNILKAERRRNANIAYDFFKDDFEEVGYTEGEIGTIVDYNHRVKTNDEIIAMRKVLQKQGDVSIDVELMDTLGEWKKYSFRNANYVSVNHVIYSYAVGRMRLL